MANRDGRSPDLGWLARMLRVSWFRVRGDTVQVLLDLHFTVCIS